MDLETQRKLVMIWAEAGPALEAMKRRELEAMTDDDVRSHVEALFTGPYPSDLPPRLDSGLVEQQRWFAKAHPKP
ncbi:MAG: hypothetical protein AB1452_07875 [Pseudomonadota bacterium]